MDNLSYLRDIFYSQGNRFDFTKGQVILNQGDELPDILLIDRGLIKITDSDKYGYGRTVAIYGKNHMLPLSWLFIEAPDAGALFNYRTLTDSTIYSLPRQVVREALDANPHIYRYLCDLTARAYVNASFRIYNLQKTNVSEKVEFVLYHLATLLSENPDDSLATIDASLTHQDIADIAGLSRESVTHLLSKPKYREIYWKKEGKSYINVAKLDTAALPRVMTITM